MKIDSSTGMYCLIGDPVEKSLSPEIHNYSFELNKIDGVYVALEVKPERLEQAVLGIKSLGIKGVNVTIPHKVEVIKYLDELDKEAELLGAVNTIRNVDGRLKGYNTDGRGFVELLKSKGVELEGKRVLMLGAGGASRAIAISLGLERVSEISIFNRTEEKARVLAEEISEKLCNLKVGYRVEDPSDYDIVVNCTSVGMYPNENQVPFDIEKLSKNCTVADIVYKPLKTKFLEQAEARGHKTVEGLGMLVNQALLSEEIWTGRKVEKESVVEEFKKRKNS